MLINVISAHPNHPTDAAGKSHRTCLIVFKEVHLTVRYFLEVPWKLLKVLHLNLPVRKLVEKISVPSSVTVTMTLLGDR